MKFSLLEGIKPLSNSQRGDNINIAGTQYDLKNNSLNIYLSGCDGACSDKCHNKELWSFEYGEKNDDAFKKKITNKIKDFNGIIDKIWVLGGEPLLQDEKEILNLLTFLNYFDKEVWLWTRFDLDEINNEVKSLCDYIKTGKYIPNLKTDDNIQYNIQLATSNQQINKMR